MLAAYNGTMPLLQDIEITPKIAAVLKVFLEDPRTPRYGMELMGLTGQGSGTVYPNLAKLVNAGWLAVSKEDIDPKVEGRPARRNYTITGDAIAAARTQLAALSEQYRPPIIRSPHPAPRGSTT
jgi:PadR family transcriptional regulator, regulatory protein PadR